MGFFSSLGSFLGSPGGTAALTAGGGALAAIAANRAGDAQADAARRAGTISQQQFGQTRADLAPFREQGTNALNRFAAETLVPLEETPEFTFARDQGVEALDRSASARGKLLSGQQVQAVQRFGTGLASQLSSDRLNRIASLAGLGQTAATNTGQFGANAAGNQGNALINAGAARASGFVGGSNAINDSINNALLFNALRR